MHTYLICTWLRFINNWVQLTEWIEYVLFTSFYLHLQLLAAFFVRFKNLCISFTYIFHWSLYMKDFDNAMCTWSHLFLKSRIITDPVTSLCFAWWQDNKCTLHGLFFLSRLWLLMMTWLCFNCCKILNVTLIVKKGQSLTQVIFLWLKTWKL